MDPDIVNTDDLLEEALDALDVEIEETKQNDPDLSARLQAQSSRDTAITFVDVWEIAGKFPAFVMYSGSIVVTMGPYLQGKEYEAAFKTDGNFSNLITKDNYEYVKEKSRHVSSAAKKKAITIAIAKIEEAFKSTYVLPSCFQLIENYDCYVTCPAYANCSSREVKKDKMAYVAEDIEKFCELFHNKPLSGTSQFMRGKTSVVSVRKHTFDTKTAVLLREVYASDSTARPATNYGQRRNSGPIGGVSIFPPAAEQPLIVSKMAANFVSPEHLTAGVSMDLSHDLSSSKRNLDNDIDSSIGAAVVTPTPKRPNRGRGGKGSSHQGEVAGGTENTTFIERNRCTSSTQRNKIIQFGYYVNNNFVRANDKYDGKTSLGIALDYDAVLKDEIISLTTDEIFKVDEDRYIRQIIQSENLESKTSILKRTHFYKEKTIEFVYTCDISRFQQPTRKIVDHNGEELEEFETYEEYYSRVFKPKNKESESYELFGRNIWSGSIKSLGDFNETEKVGNIEDSELELMLAENYQFSDYPLDLFEIQSEEIIFDQRMRLVIKLVEKNWNNCTTKISLQKGFRGNIAGDGPQAKCKKQLGLDKNGIALNIVGRRTNGKYTVTEIFPEVLQRKFGDVFPTIYSVVLEINHENISNYNKRTVKDMIAENDIMHLRYINEADNLIRDIFSTPMHQHRNILPLQREYFGTSSLATIPRPSQLSVSSDQNNDIFPHLRDDSDTVLTGMPPFSASSATPGRDRVPSTFGVSTQTTNIFIGHSTTAPNLDVGMYNFNREFPCSSRLRRQGYSYQILNLQWDFCNPCPHCGCVLFFVEDQSNIRKKCCNFGHILRNNNTFPGLKPLPPILLKYCMENKNHMGRNSVSYNNVLSLGACGVENDSGTGGFETINGDHSLLLHGRMYHFLPNNTRTGGLYFFTYDAIQEMRLFGDSSMNQRNEHGEIKHYRFYPNIGTELYNEQKRINYLVRECVAQGERVRQEIVPTINLSTTQFDIASIVSEDANRPNRRIIYQLRNERTPSSIDLMSNIMEPLCYPLLFPYGEKGWGNENRKQYKFNDYILHRFLLPERDSDGDLLLMPTQSTPPRLIPFSRFQLMFRLGQTYLVDMISRIIDYRLQFNKFTQYTLFGQSRPEALNDEVDGDQEEEIAYEEKQDPDSMEKNTFLSQSFHGSRRHLLALAQSAICLVTEFGRPTLFVTFTCNPRWSEIKEMLLEGETAYDRADITNKVFHTKLERFLHNMRNGKYFGQQHRPIYELRVIEYQQRGLPHAHMVFQLDNIPDWKTEKDKLTIWIDENINANYPVIDSSSSPRLLRVHSLIDTHMVHKCYKGESGCIDEKTGVCKRGFSCNFMQKRTVLDERGFPHYKRNTEEDCLVVPHNTLILEDVDAHVNVEYTGSTYCVIYLYKYLFKGRKKVKATFSKKGKPTDEIEAYVKGRYMCAMDAMWRTYGYQTYPSSIPAVNQIKVVLEDVAKDLLLHEKCCDLAVYFSRPIQLETYLYADMFNKYSWSYKLQKKYRDNPELLNIDYFVINVPSITKSIYVTLKINAKPSITRVGMLCILSGEIWYLREIMLQAAVRGYEDAKSFDGITYTTFQESALARGLIQDRGEAVHAFREAVQFFTPSELRGFFVMLTINGYATMDIFKNAHYYQMLQDDFLHEPYATQLLADQKLIKDLSYRFEMEEKTSKMYGFPEPHEHLSEVDIERARYNPQEQLRLFNSLSESTPNTLEQQNIFDEICESIDTEKTKLYFIQGMGGSGKSALCKKILAWARSRGKLCLGCASTGLAATVYENFNTAHSLFKYPVVEEEDRDEANTVECLLNPDRNPKRFELLLAAKVIVWDEFPSNHKEIFEAVCRALSGLKGKVIITLGDFAQIAPVVPHGSRLQIVQASIVSSPLWQHFEIRVLTKNMRLIGLSDNTCNITAEQIVFLQNQEEYGNMILSIGRGTWKGANLIGEDCKLGSQEIYLPNVKCLTDEKKAIDFLYPNQFDTPNFANRVILAGTNKEVDHWNRVIQRMNPQSSATMTRLLSADILCEVDDPRGILKAMLTTEVLNSFNNNSVPPHELYLAVGDICIILRNLSKKDALANNTRVRIVKISTFCIMVQTLGYQKKTIALPRIRFKFRLPFGQSYQLRRTQFPLRLAYCMSVNKSQGQENDAILLDLRNPLFSHGHLYVALSRVRDASKIAIFTKVEFTAIGPNDEEIATTMNIVYPELLKPVGITIPSDDSETWDTFDRLQTTLPLAESPSDSEGMTLNEALDYIDDL